MQKIFSVAQFFLRAVQSDLAGPPTFWRTFVQFLFAISLSAAQSGVQVLIVTYQQAPRFLFYVLLLSQDCVAEKRVDDTRIVEMLPPDDSRVIP